MLLNTKLGPGPRVRRRQLASQPDINVFGDYLKELFSAPPGAELDFSWNVGSETYTVSVCYSRTEQVGNWKLYRGSGIATKLIWEHLTNDIPLLHNLVVWETRTGERTYDADLILGTHNGGAANVQERGNNFMVRNLQRLFVEAESKGAQNDPDRTLQLPALAPVNKSEMLTYRGDSALTAPTPQSSPLIAHTIDLSHGRNLLCSLHVQDLGVLSSSAFLFLLEQEYYKAQSALAPMTVILAKIIGSSQFSTQEALTVSSIRNRLEAVKLSLRKTDVLAVYESGTFAFLLPETDTAGAKQFVQKANRILTQSGPNGESGLLAAFGIATLNETLSSLPALLGAAEEALFCAERSASRVLAYEDGIDGFANPWHVDGNRNTSPFKQINLDAMRRLSAQLHPEALGAFTHPAWLMFLEREYHRARRQGKPLLSVVLGTTESSATAIKEILKRVNQIQNRSDIIGQMLHGQFALISPNNSLEGVVALTERIKTALNQPNISVNVCAAQENSSLPNSLIFYPVEAINGLNAAAPSIFH
jgi:GGDEF domain-containing protein